MLGSLSGPLALNLFAVWLITLRLGDRSPWIAQGVRWLCAASMGIAFGWRAMFLGIASDDIEILEKQNEFFPLVSLLCELPATLAVYWYCSKLAGEVGRDELLSRQLKMAAGLIAVLMSAAVASVVFESEPGAPIRWGPKMMLLCGFYGAVNLIIAIWSTTMMLKLGAALLRQANAEKPEAFPIYRDCPAKPA